MNLRNKKILAGKALGVGKHRIWLNPSAFPEIKEAITKQDIYGLNEQGMILIKPVKGRKTIVKRKLRRGPGKIHIKVKHRKQDYVKITRKLRKYLKVLRTNNAIERELYLDMRKKIKMRTFKSLNSMKEFLKSDIKLGAKTVAKKTGTHKNTKKIKTNKK